MNANINTQIEKAGMDVDKVQLQLEQFKNGFPFLAIKEPASIGNGILKLNDEQLTNYANAYDKASHGIKAVKFVPASGAASRMFKALFSYLEDEKASEDDFVLTFIEHIRDFAFYDELEKVLVKNGTSIEDVLKTKNYRKIVEALVGISGLNYGSLPKGLLQFHRYETEVRTSLQEHFYEGIAYAKGKGNIIRLHFTVSPEHLSAFEKHVDDIKKSDIGQFEVQFSIQKKITDTIAVNMDNSPFVEEDGSLLFRPAGHGALLENLNEINADIIFIKNIDNVVPDRIKGETIVYKKALAGVMLEIQQKLFIYQQQLENKSIKIDLREIGNFTQDKLMIKLPEGYDDFSNKKKTNCLKDYLNRPIRICGMVKNTGEPGGGPFWVKDRFGGYSLQIAETSQLDMKDEKVANVFKNATHFNPVDLLCGVKNHKGEKYNLIAYRDSETGFITEKSKSGRSLKALELPGLWNGAMADWITLFVEVPLVTFNPVKTVNDLLRPEHQ